MKQTVKRLEKDVTAEIRGILKAYNIFHWKQFQSTFSQPKGVADILGIYKGKPLAIEVKGPKGRVSEAQQQFLDRWNREGGIGFVAWSVDDVIRELNLGVKQIWPMFGGEK